MQKPLLCVCDLDDTLLGADKKISKENCDAIKKAQQNGVYVTIATGRSHLQIREFIDILGIKIPVITCNGGVVSTPGDEKILKASYINPSRAEKICTYCEEKKLDYLMYTARNICYTKDSKRILNYVKYNAELIEKKRSLAFSVPLKCMDDVTKEDFSEAIKILVLGDEARLSEIAEVFNADKALTIVSSGKGLIDIMTDATTKGYAVKMVAQSLGIDVSSVAVFGDSPNDVSMFETAGIRVAVENAVDEVKALATHITKSNNEHGIAYAMKNIFKII